MATPISGGPAFDFGAAAQAVAAQPQTTTTVAPVKQAAKVEDTIKLSDHAQVRLLKTQGQTLAEISQLTNLSTQAVDSYLGIIPAPPATVTASNK